MAPNTLIKGGRLMFVFDHTMSGVRNPKCVQCNGQHFIPNHVREDGVVRCNGQLGQHHHGFFDQGEGFEQGLEIFLQKKCWECMLPRSKARTYACLYNDVCQNYPMGALLCIPCPGAAANQRSRG